MSAGAAVGGFFIAPTFIERWQFGYTHDAMEGVQVFFEGAFLGAAVGFLVHELITEYHEGGRV
jgi:hypothetical protein